jgi:hypothetical protein
MALRPRIPASTVSAYEALRHQVLRGEAAPAGLSAVAFHGLIHGMAIVAQETPDATRIGTGRAGAHEASCDRALVRVLANMVLQAHSEMRHVY